MAEKSIKVVCILLAVVLVAAMAVLCLHEADKAREYRRITAEYESRTEEYQSQISELRRELEFLEDDVLYCGESARFMIGFEVSDPEDVLYIKALAEKYPISPILVLDCTFETARISELVSGADEKWETMFMVSSLDDSAMENIKTIRSQIELIDANDCGVAFYRSQSISDKHASALKAAGFYGYTVYHDEPISSQEKDGMVYFDFSRIASTDVYIEKRTEACIDKNASIIYIFDMEAIRRGDLPEENVGDYLTTLAEYTKKENCTFSTVSEVIDDLSRANWIKADIEAARAKEIVSIKKHISELEDIISDIYDECFSDQKN